MIDAKNPVNYSPMEKDHRQYTRINKSLNISYRILKNLFFDANRSKDISEGGISLFTHSRFEVGTILELKIHLTGLTGPIECVGEVAWLKKTDDAKSPFMVGIRFVKIKPSDRIQILNHIKMFKDEEAKDIKWID